MKPRDNWSDHDKKTKVIKFRTFPDSKMLEFGQKITHENWSFLNKQMDPTAMVENFENHSEKMVEESFPLKEMKVTKDDKPWINQKLKNRKRQRQRVYRRQGRSPKYVQLKEQFKMEKKKAIQIFKTKIEKEVKEGKRACSYKTLRRLDPQYEDAQEYCIQSHQDQGLSPKESVEKIARFFISISEEHEELTIEKLPPNVQEEINKKYEVPVVEEYQVYEKI